MDTTTHIEKFYHPSYLDPNTNLEITKTKTKCTADIIHLGDEYDILYNSLSNKSNSFNIIDYQGVSEFDISLFTKYALSHLPKKENIVVGYSTEALNSTYWNIVFDILQNEGYKKILWIDGGLTKGAVMRHLENISITHLPAPTFFKSLFRPIISEKLPTAGDIGCKNKHFVSLGRLVRQERIYFTNKILNDIELSKKGITTCGWGDATLNVWTDPNCLINLKLMLIDEELAKFPATVNHSDDAQHYFFKEFESAIFNVVQESSIGADFRSHNNHYNPVNPDWQIVSSDRIFFTEKTAKAFLMNQIPLMIAAPGMVQVLRNLGFDMFDDIVDHSYDKEDNIFKRCDLVFNELKRLVNMYNINGWTEVLKQRKISQRFSHNFYRVRTLAQSNDIEAWVDSNF